VLRFEPSLSWKDAMEELSSSTNYQAADALNASIKAIELNAVFMELPPVNIITQNTTQFEAYITNAPELHGINPDYETFSEHMLNSQPGNAVNFYNLGRDAMLIAPTIGENGNGFAHLKTFVTYASKNQQHKFWKLVANQALSLLKDLDHQPLWVSTSGMGVSWLHCRFDIRPKYYVQKSLKRFPLS
jgi:hypothetical protein